MAAAGSALLGGDVEGAARLLDELIDAHDLPDAHALRGGLAYLDDDFEAARSHWERAHRGFRERGERRAAARVAADLSELHWSALGNQSAGRGWAAKARRLLDGEGRCVEQGYVDLALVACEWNDVDELERRAAEALELAEEFGDVALEVQALADGGFALVAQGHAAEGFAWLDEAMATISAGEVLDLTVVGKSFCAMLSACDSAGAWQRALEWSRLLDQLVLDRFSGRPRVLQTHCRLALGSVLCSVGRWDEADVALTEALGRTASTSASHRSAASAHLARLRLLQGRVEEAAELLRPHEDRLDACAPLAALHLVNGDHALAAAVIRRGIDQLVGDRLREGALLELLVEVELHRDVDAAALAAERLREVAAGCDSPALAAGSALAQARVATARTQYELALACLDEAARSTDADDQPLVCATIRFERAGVLAAIEDTAGALSEARAALAAFERLGAAPWIDRTSALLRSLGASGRTRSQPASVAVSGLTERERDVLDLVRQGLTNAEIAGRLFISAKTVEHHVGRLLAKLGVRSRAEAAAVAAAAGPRR